MQINRQRFLVVATGIASACAQREQPPPVAPPVVSTEPEPGDQETVVTEPAPGQPEARPAPKKDDTASPPPTRESMQPNTSPPTAEGLAPPGGAADNGMCRADDAAVPPRPAAPCSDARGTPGSCKAAPCSSLSFICEQCESYKRYFKPRVAERAISCVLGQTPKQARDGCQTYRCGDIALRSACRDPSAQSICRPIAQRCGTSLGECVSLLSGMSGAGRAEIAECAAGGCSFGLWSCIEGL